MYNTNELFLKEKNNLKLVSEQKGKEFKFFFLKKKIIFEIGLERLVKTILYLECN